MVGFDLPHVAHDMILRFMNVDFNVIGHNGGMDSSAHLPSSVGGVEKVVIDKEGAGDVGTGTGSGSGSGSGAGGGDGTTDKPKVIPTPIPEVDNTALWQSEF